MAVVFDGRVQAQIILDRLATRVATMARKPKMVSILVGNDSASCMYVNLKKKKGEQIGAEVEILKLDQSTTAAQIVEEIQKINADPTIDGVMVQLPLPFGPAETDKVIAAIDPKKDVDGMRLESSFIAPVVLAVMHALKDAGVTPAALVGVVGAGGFVGQRVINVLTYEGYETVNVMDGELNEVVLQNCGVVISATGQAGLIKVEMVKSGVIVIDCGAPAPEFDEGVYQKANFYTPVPGGIGPLTVAYLLSNLVKGGQG